MITKTEGRRCQKGKGDRDKAEEEVEGGVSETFTERDVIPKNEHGGRDGAVVEEAKTALVKMSGRALVFLLSSLSFDAASRAHNRCT